MTQEEIDKSQGIIADFMNIYKINEASRLWFGRIPGRDSAAKDLRFNRDWNWLIAACHKWDNLNTENFSDEEYEEYVKQCDKLDDIVIGYEIEPVFIVLVKCIEWYNTIKK